MRGKGHSADNHGAVALLDDAIQLLKETSLKGWLFWLAGFLPFALGLSYFLAEMRYRDPATAPLFGFSVGLSFLYAWRKVFQLLFTREMWQALTGNLETMPRSTFFRVLLRQCFYSGMGFLLLPVAILFTFPLGYLVSAWHSIEILDATGQGASPSASWKLSRINLKQYHTMLALACVVYLILFLDALLVIILVPGLLQFLTGGDVQAGLEQFSASPYVITINCFLLAWFAMEPLMKAAFAIRVFKGVSLRTGEDLRMAWRRLQGPALLVLAGLLLFSAPRTLAEVSTAAPEARSFSEQDLQQSIEATLQQPEFSWRRDGFSGRRMDGQLSFLGDWLREIGEFLDGLLPDWDRPNRDPSHRASLNWPAILKTVAWAVVGLLVILLLYSLLRSLLGRDKDTERLEAPPPPEPLDLESESLSGDELSLHEWIRRGDALVEEHNYRLAIRAYFLAHLSLLGEQRLLRLFPFKSNRDYLSELRAKASGDSETYGAFLGNVRDFESRWYGTAHLDAEVAGIIRSRLPRKENPA